MVDPIDGTMWIPILNPVSPGGLHSCGSKWGILVNCVYDLIDPRGGSSWIHVVDPCESRLWILANPHNGSWWLLVAEHGGSRWWILVGGPWRIQAVDPCESW